MSVACPAAQAVEVARAGGVDVGLLHRVMAAGPNRSDVFDWMFAAALEGDESRLAFSIANGVKDIAHFDDMIDDMSAALGVPATIPAAARRVLGDAVAAGRGEENVPALMRPAAGESLGSRLRAAAP